MPEYGVTHRAADVVEVAVDSVRTNLGEFSGEVIALLVIECGVIPEFAGEPRDFVVGARAARDFAAFELCDLTDIGTDRARRAGDVHRFAGFGLAQGQKAEVCGHARHAEDAEVGFNGREVGVDLVVVLTLAVGDAVFLPAGVGRDRVAFFVIRVP